MLDLVPAGTIGVPDMIHRVVEKIYGEEAALPIQLWEDASGNVAILRGGVEVTDDPMFIKELYDGCESAREILHGALRRGELVLEIEDDAGKRYAIPVTYLDSGAGFDTMETGKFTPPPGGDKQETVCFADRKMFSEWLASKYPEDMEEPKTAPIASSKSFPRGKVKAWYEERVANWKAGDPIPSEENDLTDARAKFCGRVTRAFIRELRSKLAPAAWNITTTGPKPKTPSK